MVQESDQITDLQNRLAEEDGLSESAASSIRARIEKLESIREGGMRQASEQREISTEILSDLEKIAGTPFEADGPMSMPFLFCMLRCEAIDR